MQFLGVSLPDFSEQYLQAALLVSLLSVWMLVGLFYYLNHYTKRDYFTVWTAAWLFYALWLTLGLKFDETTPESLIFKLKQCCVAISAVFLFWGSLRFLKIPVRQTLFGLFMLFLLVWTFVGPQIIPAALDPKARMLEMQLPVFLLLGLSSVFAGVCFIRLRKKMPFVGAGMLTVGFLLWGLYLASYPLSQQDKHLSSAGFFVAAVLQLFIAVSMIVLVLEEIRYKEEQTIAEIQAVRSEKEALQVKVLTTEEQCRSLYNQVRVTDGLQKAYEELRQTQQAVVQQERLRALGQMASGIAHDVNNALSPVVAYSDILLMTTDLPEESKQCVRLIKQAGEDIAQIVTRMREFYRQRSDSEPLVLVNVNQVIQEVIQLTRPRWRDIPQRDGISIQIQSELDPELPLLLSDPSELREALINLVFNAVDALPRGGTITWSTRSLKASAPQTNGQPDQQVQVEVRDNGIGMDEKTRRHCLEPFFSTKALRGGTGLGLAMVYGMMQRHAGTVEIDSRPNHGTGIRLTFPIHKKTAATLPDTPPPPPANSKQSLNILCIDDEEPIRKLLFHCFTRLNHHVVTAASGEQGVEFFRAARAKNQPFQAVITDLGMPVMDGHQLARIIKAESPQTPIIMMTGWGTMMKENGENAPEVDAIVGKPPEMEKLNDLLLRMTESKKTAGQSQAPAPTV
jgi:signal transduction histidine kinase/CheY-like chemotaxis protein